MSQKAMPPSPAMAMPPKDPNKTLSDLIATIRQLRAVYERETEALTNIDTQGFLGVQDEKFQCAKNYQAGVAIIMNHKNEMKKADPVLKKELETMQADFSELSHRNMIALERMQRIIQRLGNTMRRAAKDEAKKRRGVSYGENGAMKDDNKKRISLGVSETA
jgi:hypothetical protein